MKLPDTEAQGHKTLGEPDSRPALFGIKEFSAVFGLNLALKQKRYKKRVDDKRLNEGKSDNHRGLYL